MKSSPTVSKKTANLIGLVFIAASLMGILYLAFTNVEPHKLIASATHIDNRMYALAGFMCLTLISQFLVIPSGTILMIGGGFLLGTIPAALIYTLLLPVTGWIVGEIAASSSLKRWVDAVLVKHSKAAKVVELLKNEPVTLSAVLRLTPVIPAAIAAIVASTLKISHKTFIVATLCVGWVRPLFFASIGGAVHSMTQIQQGSANFGEKSLLPLTLLALSAILNLLIRCWLRWKRESRSI